MANQPPHTTDDSGEMSLLEHLEALRWHLLRSFVALLVTAIAVFLNKRFVFDEIVLAPKEAGFRTYRAFCKGSEMIGLGDMLCLSPIGLEIININLPAQFLLHIKVSAVLGFVIAFPYCLWELWRFIRPGLYVAERQYARGIVFYGSFLFFAGIAFGYFVLAPFSINFLGSYQVSEEVTNTINLTSYVGTLTALVLAAGLIFELPVIVYFLARLGLVSPTLLRQYRKHALIVILLVSSIITPPDMISQLLISIPLLILYEIGIFIAARVYRKQKV